jgi:hypothetical protein
MDVKTVPVVQPDKQAKQMTEQFADQFIFKYGSKTS